MRRSRFAVPVILIAIAFGACQSEPVPLSEAQRDQLKRLSEVEILTVGSKRFDHFSITNMSGQSIDVNFTIQYHDGGGTRSYPVQVAAGRTGGFVPNQSIGDSRYVEKVICAIQGGPSQAVNAENGCPIKSAKFWYGPESEATGAHLYLSGEAVLNTGETVKHEPYE